VRLLNKTSLIIITVSLFIYFLGGVGFFHFIRTMINNQIDTELSAYAKNLAHELAEFRAIDNAMLITEKNVQLIKLEGNEHVVPSFKDTVLFDKFEKQYLPYRMYQTHAFINNSNYKISIFRSTLSSENLIQRIIAFLSVMLMLLIVCLFFLNRYLFKRIWDDFFNTIDRINSFNWQTGDGLNLQDSEIEEFQTLNNSITRMTKKIRSDFVSLKEFTENASHELQTPLAIMRSKIELLLQSDNIKKEQLEIFKSLYDSVNRLASMNKVLVLLTKIENNQFPEKLQVNLQERIEFHLENFEELINSRQIQLSKELSAVNRMMNAELADMLLINLIKNAIRHNVDGGELRITLTEEHLQISNSGPKSEVAADKIFQRFTKTSTSKESIGLGLAIVKKICDINQMLVNYDFKDDMNVMTVKILQ
jgi:signal transduction histidine kinase